MNSEKLLNISQFAKISGTTRQTLIFYDRIGLLSPEKIGENGYRLYSYNQIGLITAIETLSELKVPLKEIKRIVANLTPDSAEKFFRHQLGMISKEILRMERLRDMTEIRLEQTKRGLEISNADKTQFFVRTVDTPVPLFLGENLDVDKREVPDEAMMKFYNDYEARGIPFGYTLGFVTEHENLQNGNFNICHKTAIFLRDETLANAHLPAGKYAVGYAFGDYGETSYIYPSLLKFAEQNGFSVVGDAYENYLHDEVVTSDPTKYVIEVMIGIE